MIEYLFISPSHDHYDDLPHYIFPFYLPAPVTVAWDPANLVIVMSA